MEYNTLREKIINPVYGRNFQKIIKIIGKKQNKKVITKYLNYILYYIFNISTNIKNIIFKFKNKIFIQIILLYNLIKKKILLKNYIINKNFFFSLLRKNKIIYIYKYYGIFIKKILKKIKQINLKKIKIIYIYYIANYMKKNYLKWNKIKYINDNIILKHIYIFTKGKINLLNLFYYINNLYY
ncbi:MAG: DUF4290 domain-containing protein [Candidatus Shikimatogenerans bostrichidophilus]|nr:MAG: DUF4290 domain-containing protein [Candidatus Shikimatogenerans bostrichidophilus]